MIEILVKNPLILLFLVTATGYALGRIKIHGSSLGVAAVLFVGLAVGALDPRLALPEIIFLIGLVIFVYTIGLSSGPGFFASFNRRGLRDNLFVLGVLILVAGVAAGLGLLLSLKATITAGMFAGSLTNTPALAGLLDTLRATGAPGDLEAALAEPVVGYSVAYPMGVLGVILALAVCQRLWQIDYRRESEQLRQFNLVEQEIYNRTVRVTRPQATGIPLQTLTAQRHWAVVLTRIKRGDQLFLADGETCLALGDLVNVLGAPDQVDLVTSQLGEAIPERLELDRSLYDFRRIFVSNPDIAGRRLADLRLPERFGALVTRVRQGDIDLLADGNTVVELGDRVRVVAKRDAMRGLSDFFGDSYKALSEVNLLSFGLGLTLGLLIGQIPIPLPGGVTLTLGNAGGPLIVALILGGLRRTGPIVWTLPYSANLTLRQMGLILLLAGIGVRSGYVFLDTFRQSGGYLIFLAGAAITVSASLLTLWIGYRLLKIPFPLLAGMLSALHTQPAALGYAVEQADNEIPNIGYALAFPISTIAKILLTQILYMLLR
ncbi:MAG: transporter [Caldilineaceae bacterium]|nr:transporter [Caldilineaceae bacterium]